MATLTEIEAAFAAMALKVMPSRVPVRGRVGETNAPSAPYFIYSTNTFVLPEFTSSSFVGDPPVQIVTASNVPVTLSVDIVGGAHLEDARRLLLAFRLSQRTADLYKLCGFAGVSAPVDLTAVELGTMRNRMHFEVTLNAALTLQDDAEYFTHGCVRVVEKEHDFDQTYCVDAGVNPHGC